MRGCAVAPETRERDLIERKEKKRKEKKRKRKEKKRKEKEKKFVQRALLIERKRGVVETAYS